MKIEQGLFDHMVLQRNARNVSEAAFAGTAADGELLAGVKQSGKALKGFAGVSLGRSAKGRFAAVLKGLPVGGPYDVELSVKNADGEIVDRKTVKDLLVGDVWLLGGQSNMQGVGLLKDGPKPKPLVRAFYMDDQWRVAKEPIHNMWQTVDQVHVDLNGGMPHAPATDWGVGPGVSFGQAMHELTGIPQGVIACAHGGTSMAQWDPKLKHLGSKSLYGAMVRRFRKNGAKAAGVVWYQGCSDADTNVAKLYTDRMRELIAAMRRDFGDKSLPVAMVQIATVVGWGDNPGWNMIQDQQRRLPEKIKNLAVVPAIDLSLVDAIHISGKSQIVLGRRLAQAMRVLRIGPKAGKLPIALKKVSVTSCRALGTVVVEFDNVVGGLRSGSRPAGFSIVNNNTLVGVYDIELDGNRAIIRSTVPEETLSAGAAVHYGYGCNPYCNITDAAGRSLPVFGPVKISTDRAVTPFIRDFRVSELLPSAGKLDALECPKPSAPPLQAKAFAADFCDFRQDFVKRAPEDVLVIYACSFECEEPMKLCALLGYDGPVKMWLDGSQIFHDPNGTNPALPGDSKTPFNAAKGTHELVVALSSNRGNAWGIFLRLERLDLPVRVIRKGPEFYAMPKIIG